MVLLRDILEHKTFKTIPTNLPLVLGKDIAGTPVVTDLAKMPHILIAGATGSGKSVGLNSIITGIMYKSTPSEVKMILIDPKQVELSIFKGIPHLAAPVVTDVKEAVAVLNWAVKEMEKRYRLFSEAGVNNIKGYNNIIEIEEEKLPYIVIIIDELSDLMMTAPAEVENSIIRLAQLARAAGLHLIIATQTPRAEVITGLIKSNIRARISFSVSSQIDSRIILDTGGAEKLLSNGDMLFYSASTAKPVRIQGTFISEEEIKKVVTFVKNTDAEYDIDFSQYVKELSSRPNDRDRDSLFITAGRIAVNNPDRRISVANFQSILEIGHPRAVKIMVQLQNEGIVGPNQGTKPREVLMSSQEFEQVFAAAE